MVMRTFFLLLFLTTIYLQLATFSHAQSIGNGDANADGKVDYTDIQFIMQNYAQQKGNLVDQNGDGMINMFDVKVVISSITSTQGLNVKDFGAKGDGVSNDQDAFRNALTTLNARGGGKLFVPQGTYLFENPQNNKPGVISIYKMTNIEIYGEGMDKSILKLRPTTGKGDIFGILQSKNITIRDLGLNGSLKSFLTDYQIIHNQKWNGVYVLNSKDILIERVKLAEMITAGTYLLGDNGVECPVGPCFTENITIKDSTILDNYRAGCANQGGIKGIKYINNYFLSNIGANQDIDFEPTGTRPGAENVTIVDNKLLTNPGGYALTLVGNGALRPGKNWTVTGNTINRTVMIGRIDGLNFSDNTIISETGRAISMLSESKNVTIANNRITSSQGAEAIHLVGTGDSGVKFDNNTIFLGVPTMRAFWNEGILGNDYTIVNNKIVGPVGGTVPSQNIIALGDSTKDGITRSGFVISGNKFWRTPSTQVLIGTGDVNTKLQNVDISNNVYYSDGGGNFAITFSPSNPSLFITNLTTSNNTVQPEIPAPN